MESNVQISPEYLCGVLFSASNAKVGKSCTRLYKRLPLTNAHPSNATHRSPEMVNFFTEGASHRCISLARPQMPSSISLLRKTCACPQTPRLGVKTDPKPRGGSTFLHLLSRLITRAPVVFVFFFNLAKASVLTLPPKNYI